MVESGVFEVCPPQAPFTVERHANADSAVAAAAPQARRTSNACSIRKLILQQCKIVGCAGTALAQGVPQRGQGLGWSGRPPRKLFRAAAICRAARRVSFRAKQTLAIQRTSKRTS